MKLVTKEEVKLSETPKEIKKEKERHYGSKNKSYIWKLYQHYIEENEG